MFYVFIITAKGNFKGKQVPPHFADGVPKAVHTGQSVNSVTPAEKEFLMKTFSSMYYIIMTQLFMNIYS